MNQFAARVEQQSSVWASAQGLLPTLEGQHALARAKVGWLMGRVYPTASRSELQLLADWTAWGVMYDDGCGAADRAACPDQLQIHQAHLIAVLRGQERCNPDDPFSVGLCDIRRRLLERLTPSRIEPFIASVERFFGSCVWEATNRLHNRVPDVASYVEMRVHSSAVDTYIELFAFLEREPWPTHVRLDPTVVQLSRMANNVVAWINDLLSLEKELLIGDIHNLVVSFQQHHNMSVDAATQQVMAMIRAEIDAFMALEQQLPTFGATLDQVITRNVAVLRAWMQGSLEWSYAAGRYLLADKAVNA